MRDPQIKEQLSIHYFGALATRMGYKVDIPYRDTGVDLMIESIKTIRVNDNIRYFESGEIIGVQLKATTELSIHAKDNFLRYDLRSKNYNDLIFRKKAREKTKNAVIPLLLIVLVLPIDPKLWLEIDEKISEIKMRGTCYWYLPENEATFTLNKKTKRIRISAGNKIDLDFFKNIFNLFYPNPIEDYGL